MTVCGDHIYFIQNRAKSFEKSAQHLDHTQAYGAGMDRCPTRNRAGPFAHRTRSLEQGNLTVRVHLLAAEQRSTPSKLPPQLLQLGQRPGSYDFSSFSMN